MWSPHKSRNEKLMQSVGIIFFTTVKMHGELSFKRESGWLPVLPVD